MFEFSDIQNPSLVLVVNDDVILEKLRDLGGLLHEVLVVSVLHTSHSLPF
jgi:hypothetical protein